MKLRYRRKQFWWTWHWRATHPYSRIYGLFDWGVARIKHQQVK